MQRRCRRSGWSGFGRATFPADLIIISRACVVTHNLRSVIYADSAMASVSRPSCGPTIGYESGSSSLKIHVKNFPRFAQTDQHFTPLPTRSAWAPPSAVRYDSGLYHFFYAAATPMVNYCKHIPLSYGQYTALSKLRLSLSLSTTVNWTHLQ